MEELHHRSPNIWLSQNYGIPANGRCRCILRFPSKPAKIVFPKNMLGKKRKERMCRTPAGCCIFARVSEVHHGALHHRRQPQEADPQLLAQAVPSKWASHKSAVLNGTGKRCTRIPLKKKRLMAHPSFPENKHVSRPKSFFTWNSNSYLSDLSG